MGTAFRRVLKDDSGQGLVEYGLILGFVAVACVVALTALGGGVSGLLTTISGEL